MNDGKEMKNILNKPWFRRMRGGFQTKLLKEGETKESARNQLRKVEGSRDQGGEGREKVEDCQGKVKEVECIVFVPSTPGSKLMDLLQKGDNMMSEALNAPALRFVEKGGSTIQERLGQSDPWKSEIFCQRKDCLHCQGRYTLIDEEEDRAMA